MKTIQTEGKEAGASIPPKIKIGGHWFKVEFQDRLTKAYDKAGSANSFSNLIILNAELSSSKRWSCLLHEIIHELNWQLDLGLEENQIAGIAEGLFQVLTDNGLWKWQKEKK